MKKENHPPASIANDFASVLENEAAFYCTYNIPYENRAVIHEYRDSLKDITFGEKPLNIQRFAVVDLDGNGVPEVVLEIDEYAGFVILRYERSRVYGNIVGYRTMYCLKENGFFMSSSSSDEDGWNSLYFIGDTFITDNTLYRSPSAYYAEDRCIDEKLWWEMFDAFDEAEDVKWHDYSDGSIEKWIAQNPVFDLAMSEGCADEHQDYLDSLSYLIEMTYDYTKKTQEERNASAKEYYTNCRKELDQIYQRCLEVLSEAETENLTADQQEWEENFDSRMDAALNALQIDTSEKPEDESLYYTFGDMILRRICRLADIYFSVTSVLS